MDLDLKIMLGALLPSTFFTVSFEVKPFLFHREVPDVTQAESLPIAPFFLK